MPLLFLALALMQHPAHAELQQERIGGFTVRGEVRCIAVSPDGSYVAAAGRDRRLVIWRPAGGAVSSIELGSNVRAVSASPNGRQLFAGTDRGALVALGLDGGVQWTIATGGKAISALAVSPDGGLVAIGTAGGAVELRNARDGSLFRAVGRHDKQIVDLGFTSAGQRLLSADDNGPKAWRVYGVEAIAAPSGLNSDLMGPFHVFGMAANDDHTALVGQYRYFGKGALSGPLSATGFNEDDHILVYHGGGHSPEHTIRPEIGTDDLTDLALTADSRFLAVVTERRPDAKTAGMAVVWEIEREEPRISVNLSDRGRAVSLSADGRTLAAGDASGNVVVHSVRGMETDTGQDVAALALAPAPTGAACPPPQIRLKEGQATDAVVLSRSVLVTGQVTDPCGQGVEAVWTNGERVSAMEPDGEGTARFSSYVGLSRGDQQVVVRAVSRSGAETSTTFPVRAELPTAAQLQSSSARRVRALVVGINRYAEPSLNLNFAARDAQAFAGFLTSGRSVTGLAPSDMKVFLNEQATLANLSWGFEQFLAEGGKDDVILLFYAGHAAAAPSSAAGEQLYLIPYDARPDQLATTSYPMAALRNVLSRNGAQHLIVFADTCHGAGVGAGDLGGSLQAGSSGSMSESAETINRGFLRRFQHAAPSRVVFASAERNQVAFEPVELQAGVFSYFLLRGLEGEADENADRVVTLGEIIEYVRAGVRHFTKGRQVPAISPTSFDRELPLAILGPTQAE